VEWVFLYATRRVGLNAKGRSAGTHVRKQSTSLHNPPVANNRSVQVMDEARFLDDFRVRALANDGGLFKARPASASVPRTTIEAPNSPSPALF
jgi:hypothetical protein